MEEGDGEWDDMTWMDVLVASGVTVGVVMTLWGIFRLVDWMMVWTS